MSKIFEFVDESKFEIWYSLPIQVLEGFIKHGHGGICALMIALPLYERVYRYGVLNGVPDNRPLWVKSDLRLDSEEDAKIFWNVFRDGLCHTGSFFEESEKYDRGDLPQISLSADFTHEPKFIRDSGKFIVQLNPWAFCQHVLSKYKNNSGLLRYAKAPLLPLYIVVDDKESV
jgi:hypothetical protein